MATTTTNLITWEAFEQLPDDGMRHEIIQGELIILPPPKSRHTLIAVNVADALRPVKKRGLGKVLPEAGYKLSDNPSTWIQPDVSVLKIERVQSPSPDGYFHGSPELAIEIVSPSETARDLNRKIDLLLATGSFAVWVIYPDDKEVRVFLPDGTSFTRGIADSLRTPENLGALEISIASFFED